MFRALRIALLLIVLFVVSVSSWLTRARSTDWHEPLWVKIYPVNADGSAESARYIAALTVGDFAAIEAFMAREAGRRGVAVDAPVRIELGREVNEQPPALPGSSNMLGVMWWSLHLRWWTMSVTDDRITPDVRVFVRYHAPRPQHPLENSIGMQKGMVGVVNAYAGPAHASTNNVVIAHELLHTLGATDKYDPATSLPLFPSGYAEPEREPLHPQRYAEIMGGRIAVSPSDATIPETLRRALIGAETAREINLPPTPTTSNPQDADL